MEDVMKTLHISPSSLHRVPFRSVSDCIGTGRLGLALHREYVDQLRLVQEHCHFRYIRGHGLFCDDIGIYQRVSTDHGEVTRYNFTYLDRIMDTYLELGLRPFLELGFMPSKLGSGTQTVFYWKGNVTPPADDLEWGLLVENTLKHLAARYGAQEVAQWPVEVWNEPNLPGFWEHADRDRYLHLYDITSRAVCRAVPGIRVGGPAVCGGDSCLPWIDAFLSFSETHDLPLDFLTRHVYMARTPERNGRYVYHSMWSAEQSMQELADTREVMQRHARFASIPVYVTEFNTSYHPFCPIHDTVQNAAIMSSFLALVGDYADSCSYWTFGDVFEEQGIPSTPFHGGFGLVANGQIPKPTMWTFQFFNQLHGQCVYRDDHLILMQDGDRYEGILWQICPEKQEDLQVNLSLQAGERSLLVCERVDMNHANPLQDWLNMGQCPNPSAAQTALLKRSAQPEIRTCVPEITDGCAHFSLQACDHAVIHFMLSPAPQSRDDGYNEAWYR